MVVQTDNVTRPSFFDVATVGRHKGHGVGDFHVLANTHVAHLHIALIFTGANAQERNAVTVLRIHIRLNFEYKAAEALVTCFNIAGVSRIRLWRWGILNKAVEHLTHAEVAHCRTKKHWRQIASAVSIEIELVRSTTHQFNFITQFLRHAGAQHFVDLRTV